MRYHPTTSLHLTIRLRDAGMGRRQTELIYPDHRFPPWPTEDPTPAIARTDCYAALTLMSSLFDVGGGTGSPASRKASMWSRMLKLAVTTLRPNVSGNCDNCEALFQSV
jgi:hypothetical protein